jgi:hypothetical protein
MLGTPSGAQFGMTGIVSIAELVVVNDCRL